MADKRFIEGIVASIPRLTAFAVSLTRNTTRAQDLVQDTIVRAIANEAKFTPDTKLQAWLFTIMKNLMRSEYRKRKREVEDVDSAYANGLVTPANQYDKVFLSDVVKVFDTLPTQQYKALLLIGALGFTYQEAANAMGCAIGTIKSRVNRARDDVRAQLKDDSELSRFVGRRRDVVGRPYFHRIHLQKNPAEPIVSHPVRSRKPESSTWKDIRTKTTGTSSVSAPKPTTGASAPPKATHILIAGVRFTLSHTYPLLGGEIARVYTVAEA